jgi:hypothetical protein
MTVRRQQDFNSDLLLGWHASIIVNFDPPPFPSLSPFLLLFSSLFLPSLFADSPSPPPFEFSLFYTTDNGFFFILLLLLLACGFIIYIQNTTCIYVYIDW